MVSIHREPTLPRVRSQAPPQTQPPSHTPPVQTLTHEISLARQPDIFGRRRASRLGAESKPVDTSISPHEANNDQMPTSINIIANPNEEAPHSSTSSFYLPLPSGTPPFKFQRGRCPVRYNPAPLIPTISSRSTSLFTIPQIEPFSPHPLRRVLPP